LAQTILLHTHKRVVKMSLEYWSLYASADDPVRRSILENSRLHSANQNKPCIFGREYFFLDGSIMIFFVDMGYQKAC
jgi:hypothetical protein